MSDSAAKENILKRIQKALVNPVPLPFPLSENIDDLYKPAEDDLDVLFAQEFTKLQGKFIFCEHESDLHLQLGKLILRNEWTKIFCSNPAWEEKFSTTISLATCDASITGCEFLVARTGTIVLSAAEQVGRTASVYAPVHICIAYSQQLKFDLKDALIALKEKYNNSIPSFISFATGPSRTADIEKTLVTGVHGPKEVYLFLVDELNK